MSALLAPQVEPRESSTGAVIGPPRTELKMTRPTGNALSHELQAIVDKVRALRGYTTRTGFRTTRSEKEILARLGSEDLAAVLLELENGTDNDGNDSR
jgi:hypothetical protein